MVGGAAESEVLAVVTKELAEAGVESTIALGPLLMKTNGKETAAQGGQSIVLPMPILVKSTYAVMQKATSQAYEKLVAGGDDPEMVLDPIYVTRYSTKKFANVTQTYSCYMIRLDVSSRQTTPTQHIRVLGSSFRCLDKD